MRSSFEMAIGVIALAVVAAPALAVAADQDSEMVGKDPSAQHQAQKARPPETESAAAMAKAPADATTFVSHAAKDGMAEVALGKLAVAHAQDPDVKQFGQRMIDDHSKANQELKQIATTKGITPPSQMDAKQKALVDRLSKLSGPQFDRAYIQAMVADHDEAVATFRGFSERGNDPELRAWASKTLPTLLAHERLAQATVTKLGAEKRAANTGAASDTGAPQSSKTMQDMP